MAGTPVSEMQRAAIERKWAEINRQLDLPSGYPFDLTDLERTLQGAIEGRFPDQLFVETGELVLRLPALARPTLGALRSNFDWIKKIEGDGSPTEVTTLRLGTLLRANEDSIDGQEYERRRVSLPTLGYQHAVWLVAHQDEFPALMALLGKVYIDFPGLVVVNVDGNRNFACLIRGGGRWGLGWDWAGSSLSSDGRVAVSGKSST